MAYRFYQNCRSFAILAAAMLVCVAVTGCSGDSSSATTSPLIAASSTAPSGWYKPPAVFEGLDPCTLATADETSALSGQAGLRPSRNEGLRPDMSIVGRIDTCSWVVDDFDPVAVMLQIRDDAMGEVQQGQDATSLWMGNQLGHPAHLSFGTNLAETGVEDCAAYVGFSQKRAVGVLLRLQATPTTAAPSGADNLCSRNKTVLRDVLSRVPWK